MGKILSLLLPVILIFSGVNAIKSYFSNRSKEKIDKLEQIIANGEETIGVLKSEYKERSVKIRRIRMKKYEFGYTFKVGEKEYEGEKTFTALPEEPFLAVKYLPSNPSINAANPEEELASIGRPEGKISSILIGLAMILAGLGIGFYRYTSRKAKAA